MKDEIISKAQSILDKRQEELSLLQRLLKKNSTISELFNYLVVKDKRKSQKLLNRSMNALNYTHNFENTIGINQIHFDKALIQHFRKQYQLKDDWKTYSFNSIKHNLANNHKLVLSTPNNIINLKYDANVRLNMNEASNPNPDLVELNFWVEYQDHQEAQLHGYCTLIPDLYIGNTENAYMVCYHFLQEKLSIAFTKNDKLQKDYKFIQNILPYISMDDPLDKKKKQFKQLKPTSKFFKTSQRQHLRSWLKKAQEKYDVDEGYSTLDFPNDILSKTFKLDDNNEYEKQLTDFVNKFLGQKIIPKYIDQANKVLKPILNDLKRPFKFKINVNTDRLKSPSVLSDLKIDFM